MPAKPLNTRMQRRKARLTVMHLPVVDQCRTDVHCSSMALCEILPSTDIILKTPRTDRQVFGCDSYRGDEGLYERIDFTTETVGGISRW